MEVFLPWLLEEWNIPSPKWSWGIFDIMLLVTHQETQRKHSVDTLYYTIYATLLWYFVLQILVIFNFPSSDCCFLSSGKLLSSVWGPMLHTGNSFQAVSWTVTGLTSLVTISQRSLSCAACCLVFDKPLFHLFYPDF